MNINIVLENLGFSPIESEIYLLMLGYGEMNTQQIADKVNDKVENIFPTVKKLIEKDILLASTKNKDLYVSPINPQRLIEQFEIKVEKAKMMLPELLAMDNSHSGKPQITYYEGKDGLISIMEDSLTAQTDVLCWADVSIACGVLQDYYPSYIYKKNILNIFVRVILNDCPVAEIFKQKQARERREVRIVPKDKFPFQNEINIYNDTVSIISHQEMMGVIIRSKGIAETQRSIFKMGWEYAAMLEKINIEPSLKEHFDM